MSLVAGAWIGCSSSTGDPGATGPQTCKGGPGAEFCPCNSSGGCDNGLTCAIDILQCVHIAGAPQTGTGGITGNTGGAGASTGAGNGTGSGGVSNSGGSAGSHVSGTGGIINSGGSAGGHVTGTGGTSSSGGSGGSHATGSGGMGAGGTTGTGTGGSVTATACTNLTPAANGNGEFTHYYFGQGTGKDSQGRYQTACGYLGTENNQTDTVMNIANTSPAKNTYFAAIPGNSSRDFNTSGSCGTCVQITNAGHTIIATIIDECPADSNPICQRDPKGELDLSVEAFNALGFGNGNPSGTTWKAVPCPVTGNVVVRIKPGNQNEAYIENTILALKSVSGPGGNASRQSYGAWHFNANLGSGSQLTLTDAADRMIQVTLNSGSMDQNQDTGKQFPACQ